VLRKGGRTRDLQAGTVADRDGKDARIPRLLRQCNCRLSLAFPSLPPPGHQTQRPPCCSGGSLPPGLTLPKRVPDVRPAVSDEGGAVHAFRAPFGDTRFMVIRIRLSDRKTADSDDPLGRSWYGYDPQATPAQLWENNLAAASVTAPCADA